MLIQRKIVSERAAEPVGAYPHARQVGALLFLDRPQGLEGHGAGADARFTHRYGACLLEFVEGRASRC